MGFLKIFQFCALATVAESFTTHADYFYRKDRPLLIAHRGHQKESPEHSAGAYVDAYYHGVDFLELDIQLTKDGVPIVVHDLVMNKVTNIGRYREQYLDREYFGHFYCADFTLAEIQQLKLRHRRTSK